MPPTTWISTVKCVCFALVAKASKELLSVFLAFFKEYAPLDEVSLAALVSLSSRSPRTVLSLTEGPRDKHPATLLERVAAGH